MTRKAQATICACIDAYAPEIQRQVNGEALGVGVRANRAGSAVRICVTADLMDRIGGSAKRTG